MAEFTSNYKWALTFDSLLPTVLMGSVRGVDSANRPNMTFPYIIQPGGKGIRSGFKSIFSPCFASILISALTLCLSCKSPEIPSPDPTYPRELTQFTPYKGNPVFTGTGDDTWDENIRERGYILKENDGYSLWYTGYSSGDEAEMYLGYATSQDGIVWTRHPENPVYDDSWTEDMMVIKVDSLYYMFAEGEKDIAHWLTSIDKVHWTEQGKLDIRYTDGRPLSEGPYGTPTVWLEDSTWYLFYERNDEGIWLATSKDLVLWTNVQDEPVLSKGPEPYDFYGVAMNQVIKHQGRYYGYYHGTALEDWSEWSTNIAVSDDLVHWEKYGGNPILEDNKSSGILVPDGTRYRMYTMHPEVVLHFPVKK